MLRRCQPETLNTCIHPDIMAQNCEILMSVELQLYQMRP